MTFFNWIHRREYGFRPKIGDEDLVLSTIYKSIKPYEYWSTGGEGDSEYGAVFNLEFSPEGDLLVAACQKKSVVLFDPISTKQTKSITNAHTNTVNCIKFLDNRMFATCSDDHTVALWDTRNLKQKLRSLQGHSNWVKNIEYSQKDGLLVTSGFDGSIYTWDINSYTEQGFIYNKVFHTSGLMRSRLSPDGTKLIICTTSGYLIIIHDLDLTTLAKDLSGFRPNIYRLMQLGRQFIPQAAKFDHVFSKSQKRNRVELVSDFPEHNDAEVMYALQIHPQGWCCLTRNISYDEGSEWSCIHDIQEKDEKTEESEKRESSNKRKRRLDELDEYSSSLSGGTGVSSSMHNNGTSPRLNSNSSSNYENPSSNLSSNVSLNNESSSSLSSNGTTRNSNNGSRNEAFVPDIWAAEVTVQDRACRTLRGPRNSSSANTYAYVYAISSGVIAAPSNRNTSEWGLDTELSGTPPRDEVQPPIYMPLYNRAINQNTRRLMYYIEEPNREKGFIKEPSFSADGRVICSPYGQGVRLLTFNETCSDLPKALTTAKEFPRKLTEFKQIHCHSDIVLSTKFSPRYPLLVTGCLRGKITWHQPDF